MLIPSMDMLEINSVKDLSAFEFEIKNLGARKKIIGMEIKRNKSKDKLCLSQKGYLKKVLRKFKMDYTKNVPIPLRSHSGYLLHYLQSIMKKESL